VLRLVYQILESMIERPHKWVNKVPDILKDALKKGKDGIDGLPYNLKRLLLLPFVKSKFAENNLFVSYIKSVYPYLKRPRELEAEKLIKDKKIGSTLVFFFRKGK